MKLSHEKIIHMSHVLVKALSETPGVRLNKDPNDVRLDIVRIMKREFRRDEEIERRVHAKISTQKRGIPEGSEEWDILYRKYYEEEIAKLREMKD